MREIKFRGKDVDSGEWRNGSLTTYPNDRCEIVVFDDSEILEYEVDVESVGQFTGIHDKNGKEIYEGDVLFVREWKNLAIGMFNYEERDLFSLEDCKGELLYESQRVVYSEEGSMCAGDYYISTLWDKQDKRHRYPIFEVEVIGNIHDNPNFLSDDND